MSRDVDTGSVAKQQDGRWRMNQQEQVVEMVMRCRTPGCKAEMRIVGPRKWQRPRKELAQTKCDVCGKTGATVEEVPRGR